MKIIQAATTAYAVSFAGWVGAHPGHGAHLGDAASPHPFLGVEHLILMAAVGVAVYVMRSRVDASSSDDDRE